MRLLACAALLTALLTLPARGQASDWLDDFSATELNARWTKDSSGQGTIALDPEHQVLVLKSRDNVYNHIETDLPADVTAVQADLNNVSDPAASWSPGLILYWGPHQYLRVMLSLHYGLRLELAPAGGAVAPPLRLRPVADTWYRLRVQPGPETFTVTVAQPGTELSETVTLKRLPEWTGPCRLILGKGYMPLQGGNPDFDNDHTRSDKQATVHVDNVVVGSPADLAARLAASVAAAQVAGEQDPQKLQVVVWPNVLGERTRDTVWLAEGAYQRLCLTYANLDAAHSAKRIRLEVTMSEHLAPQDVTAGPLALQVQTQREAGLVRMAVDFPDHFVLPADFHGVEQKGSAKPGWLSWPVSRMVPPVFIHCRPARQAAGIVRLRLLRDGKPGPWTEMKAAVLPPLPEPPPADRRHLGISLWQGGWMVPEGPQARAMLTATLRQLRQVGLTRLHINANALLVRVAHELGIHVNLMSWWDYSAQCPSDVLPTPEERASDEKGRYTTICPEVIATAAGTYGKFLETVTARMRDSAADGFMLDYECRPPMCYCARCREAFVRDTGLTDVAWPQEVKQGGRHYRRWIDFRCEQGARYAKVIGEAARRAKPGCSLQAWIAGYDYAGTIESAQIDISKAAAYLTEPEVPHYTLPGDYTDMWTKDAGIGSVEAGIKTVQDSLNVVTVPLVFCSSIIYPVGSATPWSDPQILNAQMLAVIGQGVRGISFWGGHDEGAIDGRFLHMLARWNAVLAAAGPYLWDGKRQDARVTVQGADPNLVRKYVWLLEGKTLVFLVNLTQQDQTVNITGTDTGSAAHQLLDGRPVDLSRPLTVPALDGMMVVLGR